MLQTEKLMHAVLAACNILQVNSSSERVVINLLSNMVKFNILYNSLYALAYRIVLGL